MAPVLSNQDHPAGTGGTSGSSGKTGTAPKSKEPGKPAPKRSGKRRGRTNTAEGRIASLAGDDEKVKALILEALAAIRSDHFDDYFKLFTDDALWMMPSSNHDVGLDEARAFYGFTKNFRFDQETSVDELVVVGDLAYVRIGFDGYLRPKLDEKAPPLRSVSRHIWILRKQLDDEWKIARDIWNNPREK